MSIAENMKLGLCILTAFSLLLGCKQDQSIGQSQGTTPTSGPPAGPNLLPRFDALLIHPGGSVERFYSDNRDPVAKAAILRRAMSAARAGDKILVGAGLFDFGHEAGNVVFPDGVTIQGLDKSVTHLFGSVWSDNQGTQFVLQNTVVSDMTLECQTYGPNEDGRTIGFDNLLPGPFNATIRRCKIIGNSWAVYNWNNFGNHLLIEDSTVVSGRLCIAAMGSGGADSQFFDVVRCKLIGDASLSNDIGATSNINYGGVFGCMVRGGVVKLIDCEMNLTGRTSTWPSWTPRVCGVSDTFNAGPGFGTTVVVVNLRCQVNPNGAPPQNCWDFDIRYPGIIKVTVTGGRGSAPDGSFRWSP
jgi:hypothetical protein